MDTLVLTHFHQDHSNGVAMLMEMVPLRQLVVPARAEELPADILDGARRHGVEITYIGRDSLLSVGEEITARLYAPAENSRGNESCMAVHLTVGDYRTLITGDSPMAEELQLTGEQELAGTELLVVGHHGSAYASAPQLLAELGGNTAVISVGYNSYGHPAEETPTVKPKKRCTLPICSASRLAKYSFTVTICTPFPVNAFRYAGSVATKVLPSPVAISAIRP